jgi:hypothetical protein
VKKAVLIIAAMALAALLIFYFPHAVDKPVVGGSGAMAILMDPALTAPEYHTPIDWWINNHKHMILRGDVDRQDCLYCHTPETSCTRCHSYAGIEVTFP